MIFMIQQECLLTPLIELDFVYQIYMGSPTSEE